jgi:thiol-disulfide isomerase/thioredoxin
MKNSIIVVLLIVIGGLFYANNVTNQDMQDATERLFGDKPAVVSTEVTNKSVDEFLPKVVIAFDKAEETYLKKEDIKPIDDGTNPDAAKCICKGTGQIRQGDGHVTACPYHAKRQEPVVDEKLLQEIEQAKAEAEQAKAEATEAKAKAEEAKVELDAQINELKAKLEAKEAVVDEQPAVVEEPKTAVVDPHPNPLIQVPTPEPEVKKVQPLEAHMATRKARPQNAIDGKVPYQVLIFSASWCAPCQLMKHELTEPLQRMGIEVSDRASADVRIVDVDLKPDLYNSLKREHTSIPLILEVVDNKVVDRHAGRMSLIDFLNRYDVEE